MVDRNPDRQAVAVAPAQCQQRSLLLVHRLHCVGQHQDAIAARQRLIEHRRKGGVHERLAPGKADQLRTQPIPLDLVEVFGDLGCGQIDEPVVAW